MARNRWIATTEAKVALAVATAKTILQITGPANIREAITGAEVSFDGTSNVAQPVLVQLWRCSAGGTLTAGAPQKLDSDIATSLQVTSLVNATVEPTTSGKPLAEWLVHPQAGMPLPLPLPDGEIILPGGGILALICTAPAIVNVVGAIRGEE